MRPHLTCVDYGGLSIQRYFKDSSEHHLGRYLCTNAP